MNRRVLIVEDEGMTRILLRRVLKGSGYEVVGMAENGIQAVEEARRLLPNVILMDVGLPGINGLEAAKRILSERSVAIIMLTGYNDDSIAHEAGACGHIVKPITGQMLLSSLDTCLAVFEGRTATTP